MRIPAQEVLSAVVAQSMAGVVTPTPTVAVDVRLPSETVVAAMALPAV
jgi:hypothetical protein